MCRITQLSFNKNTNPTCLNKKNLHCTGVLPKKKWTCQHKNPCYLFQNISGCSFPSNPLKVAGVFTRKAFPTWWYQPSWKILYSQTGSWPQKFGVKIMKNLWNHLRCDFEDSGVQTQLGEFHDQIGGASLKETCYPRHGDGENGWMCLWVWGSLGWNILLITKKEHWK